MNKIILLIAIIFINISCNAAIKSPRNPSEIEKWKLGWRMIFSKWDGNYKLGEAQFDSLLMQGDKDIEMKFLINGLEILSHLDKKDKLLEIINRQDQNIFEEVCSRDIISQKLKDVDVCSSIPKEKVDDPKLQIELIKMFVDDQATRGNKDKELIIKYNLDESEVISEAGVDVDTKNIQKLKYLINEYGFPTKKMVGKDAMRGVFFIIQHADRDKDWQMSQLQNIEESVKIGDLEKQNYAYLYDRIKVNAGQKQRYGTQFSKVDPLNKIAELAETEEMETLDQRRMEMEMMPIEMYKDFMFK